WATALRHAQHPRLAVDHHTNSVIDQAADNTHIFNGVQGRSLHGNRQATPSPDDRPTPWIDSQTPAPHTLGLTPSNEYKKREHGPYWATEDPEHRDGRRKHHSVAPMSVHTVGTFPLRDIELRCRRVELRALRSDGK